MSGTRYAPGCGYGINPLERASRNWFHGEIVRRSATPSSVMKPRRILELLKVDRFVLTAGEFLEAGDMGILGAHTRCLQFLDP